MEFWVSKSWWKQCFGFAQKMQQVKTKDLERLCEASHTLNERWCNVGQSMEAWNKGFQIATDMSHLYETIGSRLSSAEMFRRTTLFFEEISACSFEHSVIRRMYSFFSGCTVCLFPFDTVILVFSPCSPHTFACQKPSSSSIDAAKVQYTLNVGTFEQQADSFTPGSMGNSGATTN